MERYRSVDYRELTVDGSYIRDLDGQVWRLHPVQISLLRQCRHFATLEEHTNRIAGSGVARAWRRRMIREQIECLRMLGLLTSAGEVVRALRSPDGAAPPNAGIKAVAVPTRNRGLSLQRTLASYLTRDKRWGRSPTYIVGDDSIDGTAEEVINRLCLEFDCRGRLLHFGIRERARLVEWCTGTLGVPPDTALFAFGRKNDRLRSTGAMRNCLLMEMAGSLFLFNDDDVGAKTATSKEPGPRLLLTSGGSSEAWFWSEEAGKHSHLDPEECDLIGAHEALLGRALGEVLAPVAPEHCIIDFVTGGHPGRWNADANIIATQGGILGDCAWGSPIHYFTVDARSHGRLVASEEVYRASLTSRQLLRRPAQTTVSDDFGLMTYNLGLDGRDLLPPFPPLYEAEDGPFSALLSLCWTSSCAGHLPVAVSHEPATPRTFAPESLDEIHVPGVSDYLVLLIGKCPHPLRTSSTSAWLTKIGEFLIELSRLPTEEFQEFVSTARMEKDAAMIMMLETRLRAFGSSPPHWAADTAKMVSALHRSISQEWVVPREHARECSDSIQMLRLYVGAYGELLRAWTEIYAAARNFSFL